MPKFFKFTFLLIGILSFQNVQAQYFGQNKVKYKKFNFKVVESQNFETYHYLENDSLIIGFMKDAEKWKKRHSYIFKDSFDYRIPVILYSNHADFQQTSVVSGLIGTSTGGVTEGLKNRVTMPLTPSFAQTDHVLGHELVHAHQYNMIKSNDSLSFNNLANVPLWMTEGLAEYLSIGNTDEHTAMWMRDAVAHDYFPGIKDLYEARYFPYRFGHAFWAFTAGTFGDDEIESIYYETARFGVKDAFLRKFGMPIDSFSAKWKTTTENFYKPLIKDRKLEGLGTKLIDDKNGGRLNISPAVSPDGQFFIFFSEKNLFSIDLFLGNAKTGKIIRKLSTKTKDSHTDDIDGFESAGAWSSDSKRYAFISYSQGRKKIAIADVLDNEVVDEFFVKDVPSFDNLDWSPDGNLILMTGLVNGQSDLYTIDLKSKKVEQITKDYFAQIQARWSPDGSKIVFVSDNFSADSNHPSQHMSILVMDVKTKKVEKLPLFADSNNLNPVFAPDAKSIYFLSDRNGFRDIYQFEFETGKIWELTRFVTGVSGITHYAPALSVSNENDILYSLYNNSNYNIYRVNRGELVDVQEVSLLDVDHAPAKLPSMNLYESFVDVNLNNESIVKEATKMTQEPYKPKFKLDYISSGGLGVSSGRYGTGMSGGVNMLFGDMLNDNQLYVGVVLNGELQDFGGQVAYLNSKSRYGWGGGMSHIPYRYFNYGLAYEDITYNGSPMTSLVETYYIYRMFQEQASFFTYYPFSKITRLEASTSSSYYHFRLDKYKYYYDETGYYYLGFDDERNLDAGDPFFIQDINLAYVGDDSSFGMAAPMKGYRYRLEAQQSVGDINMTALLADVRKYFYAKPVGFAFRGLSYNRIGSGAKSEILPPLYLGYETIVRGYTYDAFDKASSVDGDALNPNDLLGSKMLVSSFEVRFPFTGPERLAAIKSGVIFSDLNLFFDAGVAWGYYYDYDAYYNQVLMNRDLSDSKIITSAGISARINLFGQLIIEPYYAFPLQLAGNGKGVFGLNFTPGW
jgi:Tol biopolymer transport system component